MLMLPYIALKSTSWGKSNPNSSRTIWLAIRMTGARLRFASTMPLMKCRLPGPQLPATAVRLPVNKASPWAAKAPAPRLFVAHTHPLDRAFGNAVRDPVESITHDAVTMPDARAPQRFDDDI